jgi:hypothetical protein
MAAARSAIFVGLLILEERKRSGPTDVVILGVDLGKNVYGGGGLDDGGRVVLRRRLRRSWIACVYRKARFERIGDVARR